ncbi:guanine nucleotide binding protein, alpha subunit [Russula earlei]|uniref:Guanine nucleotide binding protein, alpha subunit n=1 Tax=Russula earlei TaxID=71964 RepID=A0ACC0U572_9AGAM|nr:guanine nucleotide binding protein, alpha subunit [Russula earlei]
MFRSSDSDPLAAAIAPPHDESPDARTARLRAEAEARRVSDEIDEQLKQERAARRRLRPCVKVLLLGQSESGKSTTLKNFQLQYARETWIEERSSWRAIIQLNLIRTIVTVLDLVGEALASSSYDTTSLPLTEKHRLLHLRLTPLRGVQLDLQRRLGAASTEETFNPGYGGALPRLSEFAVRSRDGWRSPLKRFRTRPQDAQETARAADARVRKAAEVTEVVVGCADDMKALWEDSAVRDMLRRKKIRMEEEPGFFLNDIDRIAARDYEPSDNDVIRARLRTLGVQEYNFWVEQAGHEWLMYDVGGTRSSVSHKRASLSPPLKTFAVHG